MLPDRTIDDDAEGAGSVMPDHQDDGLTEARVAHGRRGHEQLARERSPLRSIRWRRQGRSEQDRRQNQSDRQPETVERDRAHSSPMIKRMPDLKHRAAV